MSSAAAETTPIPTATSVVESTVIEAPLSHVWHHIKLENFSKFWSALSASEFVKGTTNDTDVVKWTFKDGTELEVKQEEHSVSPSFLLILDFSSFWRGYGIYKSWIHIATGFLTGCIDHQPLHHLQCDYRIPAVNIFERSQHHPPV